MRTVVHFVIVSACSLPLLVSGSTAFGQAPPVVPPPTTTLWNFLGIPQAFNKMQDATLNKTGKHPAIERKPPLKRIGDPANLFSKNPAIKTAAEIKMEEDLKQQKIKAIRYLATIGCGCYPGVKEALLAALDDCTEEVRYEAALALANAAGNVCRACGKTCCDLEVRAKLADVAFGMTEDGCPKEASSRVRDAARMALMRCGGPPVQVQPEAVPREVPLPPPGAPAVEVPQPAPPAPLQGLRRSTSPAARTLSVFDPRYQRPAVAASKVAAKAEVVASQHIQAEVESPAPQQVQAEAEAATPQAQSETEVATPVAAPAPVAPATEEEEPAIAKPVVAGISPTLPVDEESVALREIEPTATPETEPVATVEHREPAQAEPRVTPISHTLNQQPTAVVETVTVQTTTVQNADVTAASKELHDGRIAVVDAATGTVQIALTAGRNAEVGKRARVFHQEGSRQIRAGELEIVDVVDGAALARPLGDLDLNRISVGDSIFLYAVGASADRVASR